MPFFYLWRMATIAWKIIFIFAFQVGDEKFDQFDCRVLEMKQVANMTGRVGRVRRFSILVVTGNKNGLVATGMAKAVEARVALKKARNLSIRKLRYVELFEGRTVYHDFHHVIDSTAVFVQRKPEGTPRFTAIENRDCVLSHFSFMRPSLSYWSIQRSIHWLIDWLIHWLIDPLTDWLIDWLTRFFASCDVIFLWLPPGYGFVGHRAIKTICDVIGIRDLYAKVEGTPNMQKLVKCFLAGLEKQETHGQLSDRTGLHVVEFKDEKQQFPHVLASPVVRPVRQSPEEIGPMETVKFTDLYSEGKVRLVLPKRPPFYTSHPSWQKKLRQMERTRNWDKMQKYHWVRRELKSGEDPFYAHFIQPDKGHLPFSKPNVRDPAKRKEKTKWFVANKTSNVFATNWTFPPPPPPPISMKEWSENWQPPLFDLINEWMDYFCVRGSTLEWIWWQMGHFSRAISCLSWILREITAVDWSNFSVGLRGPMVFFLAFVSLVSCILRDLVKTFQIPKKVKQNQPRFSNSYDGKIAYSVVKNRWEITDIRSGLLISCLIDWCLGRLIDWLINGFSLIDWSICWLIDWLIEWFFDCLIDWLLDFSFHWLIDRCVELLMIFCLLDLFIYWLNQFSLDWLID